MTSLTGSLQATLLAAAFAAATAGTAAAADLPSLPPPPPIEAPPPAQFSGWYLRGDVGYGFDQLSNYSSSVAATTPGGITVNSLSLGNQAFIGGGFGYQLNNWFRGDITAEYRSPTHFASVESDTFGDSALYTASISSTVVLANGYVDLGTWYGITPFVGAGVGGAFHQFNSLHEIGFAGGSAGTYSTAPDNSTAQFAWALMGGLDYWISPNWRFELGYRYLDMGHVTSAGIVCGCGGPPPYESLSFHLASQDVRFGLRYIFAEVPPPAPPQLPLVSKY